MCRWRPVFPWGGFLSLLGGLAAWTGTIALLMRLPDAISAATFWLGLAALIALCVGAILLYWTAALFSLRYAFDRNRMVIHWGLSRQVIPMNRITAVRRWHPDECVAERGLHGLGLPVGYTRSEDLGAVRYFATRGRTAQVLVCTPQETFVLSPRDPDRFLQEMELRRALGVTLQAPQEVHHGPILGLGIWRERAFWALLAAGLVLNLALWAVLCYRFPELAARGFLTIRYREVVEEGQRRIIPEVIGRPADLFRLPLFGAFLLGGNAALAAWLHRSHRPLIYLLGATGLFVQLLFWVQIVFLLAR